MQLAHATTAPAAASIAARLDELGRTALVSFDYRPIPGNVMKPPLQRVSSAIALWTEQAMQEADELGWDDFWAARPAGAGRLAKLDAASYDDAVRAARALALTTRPNHADGNKQAQGVLQLADGSFYAAPLGGIDDAARGMWLLRMGSYEGYWRPTATSLVPELVAVVGGASMVDLRGKQGLPVKT